MKAGLTVFVGSMFSGKSESLIQRAKRAIIARKKVIVFKPVIDTRYGNENITSHSSIDLESATGIRPVPVRNSSEIREILITKNGEYDMVCFDEVQFFDKKLIPLVVEEVSLGKRVVCTGLDLTSSGEPFGIVPSLLALADEVIKLTAVCMCCGEPATRTFRKQTVSEKKVLIGGAESYEARCFSCWKRDFIKDPEIKYTEIG